ncbi:MAG: DUF742 domain-containing protein [Nocardioides sp.]
MSLTEPDPWGRYSDEEPTARIVRPYTITAGRTKSAVDLPMEATLRLEPAAREREWGSDAQGRIVEICDNKSVAEVSAALKMPIGVIRVLLGDLVEQHFVAVQATLTDSSSRDERLDLIERTLRGLRAF